MIDIDLLRKYRPETDLILKKYRSWIMGFSILLGLMLLIPLVQLALILNLGTQIDAKNEFLHNHTMEIILVKQMNDLKAESTSRLQLKNDMLSKSNDWHGFLEKIRTATPASVKIDEFAGDEKSLRLTGISGQATEVSLFLVNLRQLPEAKDVTLESMEQGTGNTTFTIILSLAGGGQ